MKKHARTTIGNITTTGLELADEKLAMVIGGQKIVCGGETPYETSTATLKGDGGSDTQTDCTSKKP